MVGVRRGLSYAAGRYYAAYSLNRKLRLVPASQVVSSVVVGADKALNNELLVVCAGHHAANACLTLTAIFHQSGSESGEWF